MWQKTNTTWDPELPDSEYHHKAKGPNKIPLGVEEYNRKAHKDYYLVYKGLRYNGKKMSFARLHRFMDAHIGKNVDKVFKEFCEICPPYYAGWNFRTEFWDLFRERKWHKSDYYLDKQNRVQRNQRRKRTCRVYLKTVWYRKKDGTGEELKKFKEIFGKKADAFLALNSIEDTEVDKFYYRFGSWNVKRALRAFFRPKDFYSEEVVVGSNEWYALRGMQKPVYYFGGSKKAARNIARKAKKAKYNAIYNEALAKSKEKLKKEKEPDIITRDRLGFDANSFVNNPKETYDKERRIGTSA